jgi:hypothetical protein
MLDWYTDYLHEAPFTLEPDDVELCISTPHTQELAVYLQCSRLQRAGMLVIVARG